MQTTQKRLLSALQRVQGFLDAHGAVLAAVNASETRTRLDTTIEVLERLGLYRDPTQFRRRQEQEIERRQRLEIRSVWMTPIARIARVSFPKTEEFRCLRLPSTNIDIVGFILAAREMLLAAQGQAAVFVGAGLPADFPAQMETAIDALQDAVAARERSKAARVGATARLKAASSEGRGAVSVIDALIAPVIATDQSARADWESTKQVVSRAASGSDAPDVGAPVGCCAAG